MGYTEGYETRRESLGSSRDTIECDGLGLWAFKKLSATGRQGIIPAQREDLLSPPWKMFRGQRSTREIEYYGPREGRSYTKYSKTGVERRGITRP